LSGSRAPEGREISCSALVARTSDGVATLDSEGLEQAQAKFG
jgi:hypothetical protein